MDVETGLISKIILENKMIEVVDEGLKPELFYDKKSEWEYLSSFFSEHGAVPNTDIFEKEFPEFEFKSYVDVPLTYLITELRKKKAYSIAAETLKKAANLLKEKDPFGAIEAYKRCVLDTESDARPSKDYNLTENPMARLDEYHKLEGGITGFTTPWAVLDEATLGYQNEQLVLLVARSAIGKTWYETINARWCWGLGHVPLLITKEMSVKQIVQRIDAIHARLNFQRFRSKQLTTNELGYYEEALKEMENKQPFYVSGDDIGTGDVSGVAAKIEKYHPDIVFIDGVYFLGDVRKATTRHERLEHIFEDLKKVARNFSIPVVLTHQFNKEGADDKGTADTLAYADVQKWCDLIIGMYQTEDLRLNKEMEFKILKQRDGIKCSFVTSWDLDNMNFVTKGGIDDVPIMGSGIVIEGRDETEEVSEDEDLIRF